MAKRITMQNQGEGRSQRTFQPRQRTLSHRSWRGSTLRLDGKDVKNIWYPSNGTLFIVTKEGEVAIRLTPVNKHVSTPPFPKSDDNHWRL